MSVAVLIDPASYEALALAQRTRTGLELGQQWVAMSDRILANRSRELTVSMHRSLLRSPDCR